MIPQNLLGVYLSWLAEVYLMKRLASGKWISLDGH